MVNGQDRNDTNLKHYLRVSCYIQQDDELRPLLTVEEAMTMASNLKLGYSISTMARRQQVILIFIWSLTPELAVLVRITLVDA